MPKIVDHAAMRQGILSRCFHYFAYKGYRGVTMRSLAKALDISTGTLYHYFSNKSDLFTQMLQKFAKDDIAQALEHIGDSHDPLVRFQKFIEFIKRKEEHFRELIYLFIDLHRLEYKRHDETGDAELTRANQLFEDILKLYVEAIETHLGLPFKNMGHFVMSFLIGHLIFKLIDPSEITIEQLKGLVATSINYSPLAQHPRELSRLLT